MKLDKSLITNLLAGLVVIIGLVSPVASEAILAVGLFALSGALTNWLAIHMLFEKVPLMYGSGVIPNRFEEFKAAIKKLIMEQFFNRDNLKRFIADEEASIAQWLNAHKLVEKIDYNTLFDKLVEAILESSFGGMLNMFGGASTLQNLREPVIEKVKESLNEMVESDSFQQNIAHSINGEVLSRDISSKIETIIDKRLQELTPQLVKQIVQDLIKQHLGWLVVWGGVVGGLIGLLASFMV